MERSGKEDQAVSITKLCFLSAEEVRAALPMAEAVEVMKEAFALLSAGSGQCPQRTHIHVPGRIPDPRNPTAPIPGPGGTPFSGLRPCRRRGAWG